MPKIIKPEERRDVIMTIRFTKNEYKKLRETAKAKGLFSPQYIRVLLGFEKIVEE